MKPHDIIDYLIPTTMALQLILGILQVLDVFGVMYQPLIKHGFELASFTVGFDLVWPMAGLLVLGALHSLRSKDSRSLLACVPIIFAAVHLELGISLASISYAAVTLFFTEDRHRFFRSLLMVLVLFYCLGVIHYGVLLPLGLPSPFTGLVSLELNVHYVLASVAPILVFPFLYFWFLRPLIDASFVLPRIGIVERSGDGFSRLLLVFAVYLSIYSALYPYFPTINPRQMLFAADVYRYADSIALRFDSGATLLDVIGMQKALFYLFFKLFQSSLGLEVQEALSAIPLLFNPSFVLASYFFLWECFRNSRVASWGAFFASTGQVMTAGMFMNYLSNNLALILVLSSLGLLFRAVRLRSLACLSASSFLAALLVYTHPWTMLQYLSAVAAVVGVAIVSHWFGGRVLDTRWVRYAAIFLFVVFLSEVVARLVFRTVTGVSATTDIIWGTSYLFGFWGGVVNSFKYSGGLMANLVPMLFAVIGIYTLISEGPSDSYIMYMVALTSIVYLISAPTNKGRLFYNLPIWLFAALGLTALEERVDVPIQVFTIMYSLHYLFMALANIVY